MSGLKITCVKEDHCYEVSNIKVTAQLGAQEVGHMLLSLSPSVIHIKWLNVHYDYQRQGIATALFTTIKEKFPDIKISALVVHPHLISLTYQSWVHGYSRPRFSARDGIPSSYYTYLGNYSCQTTIPPMGVVILYLHILLILALPLS